MLTRYSIILSTKHNSYGAFWVGLVFTKSEHFTKEILSYWAIGYWKNNNTNKHALTELKNYAAKKVPQFRIKIHCNSFSSTGVKPVQ